MMWLIWPFETMETVTMLWKRAAAVEGASMAFSRLTFGVAEDPVDADPQASWLVTELALVRDQPATRARRPATLVRGS